MFSRRSACLIAVAVLGSSLAAGARAAGAVAAPPTAEPSPSRGQLLYDTHCLACHTSQIHWRDRKLARDWHALRVEVDRWQRAAGLGWSRDDVDAVARHLNQTIYGFPAPVVSGRGPA